MNPQRALAGYKRDYEYHYPMSYGGAAGTYTIQGPYGTTCEYRVELFNGSGVAVISDAAWWHVGTLQVPFDNTAITIPTASDQSGNGFRGFIFLGNAQDTMESFGSVWVPMGAPIYFGTAQTGYITLCFRRVTNAPPIAPIFNAHTPENEMKAAAVTANQVAEAVRLSQGR